MGFDRIVLIAVIFISVLESRRVLPSSFKILDYLRRINSVEKYGY